MKDLTRASEKKRKFKILEIDPWLAGCESDIELRMSRYEGEKARLLMGHKSLSSFANGRLYFGFHRGVNELGDEGWFYREWAPNADGMHLIGDFNNWDRQSHKMNRMNNGIYEIFIKGRETLTHSSRVKTQITVGNYTFDRIPLYCKRVIQDPHTHGFNGQVWAPPEPYKWTDEGFAVNEREAPFIYECHIGMSGEEGSVADFNWFTDNVLPRIKKLGYNTIQLMAIMEHAYYASFGYQITNFYAVSSRFGTPEDLKRLIDTAHGMGIAVLLDIVHSHASSNVLDGIGEFDGTDYQFFHRGSKGVHPAWGTKLFNYGKPEVLHFLLSNIKFWLTEYHFDGFRFDGVTSMMYHDHALGYSFDSYDKYFSLNTDVEAVTYLQLAAELTKEVRPDAILIAEDMSGMPGMCLPIEWGGIGFDYRLAMGVPDFWISTLREKRDEDWDLGKLWHELNTRRPQEKAIGYSESHDQALVGDKTIMFWLADKEMYWHMDKNSQNMTIDRAIELHKMIRFITCLCAGEGYLNFMGNEFGHPEWIDFPREGNGWSYQYARRQWSLADNPNLRYCELNLFDRDMVKFVKGENLLAEKAELIEHAHNEKSLIFKKGKYIFIFNFHPTENFYAEILCNGNANTKYRVVLNSGWERYGGYAPDDRSQVIEPETDSERCIIRRQVYPRQAIVITM